MSHASTLRFRPRFLARSVLLLLAAGVFTVCDKEPTGAPLLPKDVKPLFTQHSEAVVELPPLPGGYASLGEGVNDNGDVVGSSWFLDESGGVSRRPTLWPGNGGPPIELAGGFNGEAHAINNRGDIVGWDSDAHRAVLWSAGAGAVRYLTPMDANFPAGEAFGINDQGDVVGRNLFFSRARATVWTGGNTPQQLHSTSNLPSAWASIALDINSSGLAVGVLVIGNFSPSITEGSPVIFTGPGSPPLRLRSVDNALRTGAAHGINDAGDVVGWADDAQRLRRAVRWPAPDRVAQDLLPLNQAFQAQAFGISDHGDIVGSSGGTFGTGRATLWPANGGAAQDLGGPGVSTSARGISPNALYAAGSYAASVGPLALRFRITAGPPSGDADGDGIATNVDVNPTAFSNAFSDVPLGGTTSGIVVDRGDQLLSIVDDAPPNGLRVTAAPNGGAAPATIELCGGPSSFNVTAGDDFLVTCGSVIVSVLAGSIEIRFVAADGRIATTSVDAGNGLTFDPATFVVTAPASNPAAIVITVSNNPFTLGPGQSVQLVRDETPPSLTVANLTVPATSPNGATVSYSVSAVDNFDPNPVVACAPPANGLFAIGTTDVGCTATDVAGNRSSATFTVTVLGAREQIVNMIQLLTGTTLSPGAQKPLILMLERALSSPTKGHIVCSALDVFITLLEAKSGEQIPATTATQLAADATRIKAVLLCPTQPPRGAGAR